MSIGVIRILLIAHTCCDDGATDGLADADI